MPLFHPAGRPAPPAGANSTDIAAHGAATPYYRVGKKMNLVNISELTPLLIYQNEIFAPVRVNQILTLAQLDTGANIVSISRKLAKNVPITGKMKIGSAFDQKVFDVVENLEIEFFGHKYQTKARIFENSNEYPFDTNVILNSSIIYGQPLIFDFRLLHLVQPHQLSILTWSEVEAKYLEKTNLCLIQLKFAEKSITALFDTGAGISAVNSAHLKELQLNLKPAYDLDVGDSTGAKTIQTVMICSDLSVNNWILPSFDCFATDLKPIENAIGHRIDLIFGINLMLKSGLRWLFDKYAEKVFIAE